jgi:spore maturation protein CgeB
MKILYVDLEFGYGIESYGPNYIGRDGFLQSLLNLGHHVDVFYYDEYLNNTHKLQLSIKDFADKVEPNLIFFSLFSNQFEIETLEYLKSRYMTINWFGDDQWRFDEFSSKYARHFSYCVTTDQYAIPKYRQLGQENIIYSQWAAIKKDQMPKFQEYKNDVVFVGAFHPYRKWFIECLIKENINVKTFGYGWPNGPVSSEEMNELFISSKINLNIGNSISFDIRYLLSGIRPFINTLRSPKNSSQTKARNFEIPFFNGFQLTDYTPSIENYFSLGKEIVCYKDIDQAIMLVKYYLENETERELIKNAGHERAFKEHSYINRLKDVLDRIK